MATLIRVISGAITVLQGHGKVELGGELVRLRYNTMADETPGGAFKWRVILERDRRFEEVPVRELILNVPSFSKSDEMPVVGRKHHMACDGVFSVHDGIGCVEAANALPEQCVLEHLNRHAKVLALIGEPIKGRHGGQSDREDPKHN